MVTGINMISPLRYCTHIKHINYTPIVFNHPNVGYVFSGLGKSDTFTICKLLTSRQSKRHASHPPQGVDSRCHIKLCMSSSYVISFNKRRACRLFQMSCNYWEFFETLQIFVTFAIQITRWFMNRFFKWVKLKSSKSYLFLSIFLKPRLDSLKCILPMHFYLWTIVFAC